MQLRVRNALFAGRAIPAAIGKAMVLGQPERLDVRASPELLAKIDAWRARQGDAPSRAEAVRRLVDIALRTDGSETAVRQFGRRPE